jgi:hypothetical protein
MVELATSTPLQDHCIAQAPFQVISSLLSTVSVSATAHTYQNIYSAANDVNGRNLQMLFP